MVSPLLLSIGGFGISVVSEDPSIEYTLDKPIKQFIVNDIVPDIKVAVAWGEKKEEDLGRLLLDSGGTWRIYGDADSYWLKLSAPRYPRPYKYVKLSRDFKNLRVLLNQPFYENGSGYPLHYPVDELLIINFMAANKAGGEVHSCGLVDTNGLGYLFAGQSGLGKSTTARLWKTVRPGVSILSDDRIIIRKEGGRFWMYGTPWHGEAQFSKPERAHLSHIFFLAQAPHNRIHTVTPAEAVARLFSCSFPTYHNPEGLDFTFSFFEDLVGSVPCSILDFTPNKTAVETVCRYASHIR